MKVAISRENYRFQPITVTLTLESDEDLEKLRHLVDCWGDDKKYCNMADQVKDLTTQLSSAISKYINL